MDLVGSKVLVTGGTGFLGAHVVRELATARAEVVGVGSGDHDLRSRDEIDRLLDEVAPDAVVHLAAVTGGIGANRASRGRSSTRTPSWALSCSRLAALMASARWRSRVRCAPIRSTRASLSRRGPVERVSRGDERSVRAGQEDAARPVPGVPRAVRHESDPPPGGQPRRPRGQLRPLDEPRDPGHDPSVRRGATHRSARGGPVGRRQPHPRVHPCPRRRHRVPARPRELRRRRSGERRVRSGDLDPGPGREGGAPRRVRRRHHMGHLEAKRSTEPSTGHHPGPRALRVRGHRGLRRRAGRDHHVVP